MIPRKIVTDIDKKKLAAHMVKDMVGEDRRLRFGYPAPDTAVEKYLEASFKGFGWDNMWFVVLDEGKVVASCHVAYIDSQESAEMGCTVAPSHRGTGIGQQLYDRGLTWARMRGAKEVYMQCLAENKVIQHIAKKNGMSTVVLDGSEREATIDVHEQSQAVAMMKDAITEQIAIVDASVRKQQWLFSEALKMFTRSE